jgi:omega-amidase
VHLFDIDIPGGITFKESDTLTSGSAVTVVDTPFGKLGVGICYDLRFSELSLLMREMGASLLVFPGAFNTVTGPVHWELLQRARALDTQSFVLTASPARAPVGSIGYQGAAPYQAWGHSSVVGPWGDVQATTGHEPAIVRHTLDLTRIAEVRQSIPISKQRRLDLYVLDHAPKKFPERAQ